MIIVHSPFLNFFFFFFENMMFVIATQHFDGLVQESHNSIANALELCLSCTNPSIWTNAVVVP